MKKHRLLISGKKFYFRILCFSFTAFFTFTILFLCVSTYTNYNKTGTNIRSIENSNNEKITRQFTSFLSQTTVKMSYFSQINIPVDYLENHDLYWSKYIFDSLIKNNFSGTDYISFFSFNSGGNNYSLSQNSSVSDTNNFSLKIGSYSPYVFFAENTSDWPYNLLMTYEGNSNKYKGSSVVFNTSAMGNYIFSDITKTGRQEYILSSDGYVLLSNNLDSEFKNFNTLYPNFSPDSEKSLPEIKINGVSYYVFSTSSNENNFLCVSFVPKKLYKSDFNFVLFQNLLIASVFCIIGLLFSYQIISMAYKPIKETVAALQFYVPDDTFLYKSEAAFLTEKVKETLKDKHELELQLPATIKQLHEAQFAALQSQINSHFLFNTLENIKSISVNMIGMDNPIEDSILRLNKILFESLQQKSSVIPLKKELSLATDYLELMKLRFERFDYNITSDSSLDECFVFKFSIQPVLENCFKHAFTSSDNRNGFIDIIIYRENSDVLCISVTDNGGGFDESVIKLINSENYDLNFQDTKNHFGISNINTRIHTVFGNKYGIKVQNNELGATVIIKYPVVFKYD